jgi:hypothetical protein
MHNLVSNRGAIRCGVGIAPRRQIGDKSAQFRNPSQSRHLWITLGIIRITHCCKSCFFGILAPKFGRWPIVGIRTGDGAAVALVAFQAKAITHEGLPLRRPSGHPSRASPVGGQPESLRPRRVCAGPPRLPTAPSQATSSPALFGLLGRSERRDLNARPLLGRRRAHSRNQPLGGGWVTAFCTFRLPGPPRHDANCRVSKEHRLIHQSPARSRAPPWKAGSSQSRTGALRSMRNLIDLLSPRP